MGGSRVKKLVVLGSGGVGKSSLVMQYLEGIFTASYKPTVEDYYRHTVKMPDGAFHAVEILDTSGSLNFPAMRDLSIRSGRGFVLVFSVDNAHTFDEAVELWDHILRLRGDKVPVVLVGNKTDLVLKRQVTEEMVRAATQERSPCRYVETSAKSNSNVALLFQELLEHAEELERPPAPPPGSRRLSRRLSSIGTVNFSLRRSSVPREGQEKDKKMRADSKSCTIM